MSVEVAVRVVDERNSNRNWSPASAPLGTRLQSPVTSMTVVVAPVPFGDQPLSPSALVAFTWNTYDVPGVRLFFTALARVTFCGPSLQSLVPCTLYRRA